MRKDARTGVHLMCEVHNKASCYTPKNLVGQDGGRDALDALNSITTLPILLLFHWRGKRKSLPLHERIGHIKYLQLAYSQSHPSSLRMCSAKQIISKHGTQHAYLVSTFSACSATGPSIRLFWQGLPGSYLLGLGFRLLLAGTFFLSFY